MAKASHAHVGEVVPVEREALQLTKGGSGRAHLCECHNALVADAVIREYNTLQAAEPAVRAGPHQRQDPSVGDLIAGNVQPPQSAKGGAINAAVRPIVTACIRQRKDPGVSKLIITQHQTLHKRNCLAIAQCRECLSNQSTV